MLLEEAHEQRQSKVDAVKRAIVSGAGLADPLKLAQLLFPDMFEEQYDEDGEGEAVSSREDLTNTEGVKWKFTERIDPAEAQKIMASMVADPNGRLLMEDLDDEGWT